ncbi:MAG: 1,2-phenylacetyl-CoA epoxidase subunit PaaD [Phycisphaerae bacterium]
MAQQPRTDAPSHGDAPDDRIQAAWNALTHVPDPEIPVVSVVELGMIAAIRAIDDTLVVDLTPTFAACPALDHIRLHIADALASIGESDATVNIVFDPPWTTDRITPTGRDKLQRFGIAPPRRDGRQRARPTEGSVLATLEAVPCPNCNATDTELESIFGPTLCRSIHYCRRCLQSFEHFKNV